MKEIREQNNTVSEVNSNTKISGKKGLIDNLYTLYTDGTIKGATLTITYTDEELTKYELNEDNLSIYHYNEKGSKYAKVDSTIDKSNKTVTAKLKHFSNYVLGAYTLIKETSTNQILFILDNSWSMYTNEQYKEYTGKEYSGGLHAINAISLVQDIDNPNLYYIGVYDNNYPGEKRYVNLECNKGTCVTKANNYYTSSGEPVRITSSLEYDLAYYNN